LDSKFAGLSPDFSVPTPDHVNTTNKTKSVVVQMAHQGRDVTNFTVQMDTLPGKKRSFKKKSKKHQFGRPPSTINGGIKETSILCPCSNLSEIASSQKEDHQRLSTPSRGYTEVT
jgi:hypothetical protein